jgi:uncharacterized protein YicC (UPF0701 family)
LVRCCVAIGVPGTDFAFPLADLKGVRLAVASSDKDIRKNTCAHLRDVINMDLRKEDDNNSPGGEQLMTLSSIMAMNARSQRDSAINSARADRIEAARKDSARSREGATANENLIAALGLIKNDDRLTEADSSRGKELSRRRNSKSLEGATENVELTTLNRSANLSGIHFDYNDI